jgi:parallel beta-helix repeat protein
LDNEIMKKILLIAIAGFGITGVLSAQDISAHNGTFSGTLSVTGAFTGSTGTFSGALTAGSLSGSGAGLTFPAGGVTRTIVDKLAENVSAKDYGAVGDGTADDSPSIAAAIAALPNGAKLYFPPGRYRLCSTISISKPFTISGAGRDYGATYFVVDAGVAFELPATGGVNTVSFENLRIESAARTANSVGIKAVASSPLVSNSIGYLRIQNVEVVGFDRGIDARFCQLGSFKDLHLLDNTIGLYLKRCVNETIEGGVFEHNDSWGIFIDGDEDRTQSAGTRIIGVTVVLNGADGGGNFQINSNESFSIVGGMFDKPADTSAYNVLINHTSRGGISGNTWVGASKGPGIQVFDCDSVKISGCDLVGSATFGITVLSSNYCVISGNVLRDSGNADIAILYGGQANGITDNTCTSTSVAYSIVETGPYKTSAVGNRTKGSIILDGGSNVAANYMVP